MGLPECGGYYGELKQFLNDYPPEYWWDWVSDKAAELEEDHVEENKSVVSDFLSQRLERRARE